MKKQLTILTICLLTAGVALTQNQKYIDAMTKAIHEFDSLRTTEQFLSVANKFERIALAEKTQWLPYYYASLSKTFSQYVTTDYSRADEIMDVAQRFADKADSLEPNNAEIVLLKSMILSVRIMVDPMSRGQLYGMQSMMMNSQAMSLDPSNPRPYLVMGQSLFYTPPQFGGGTDKACKMFAIAKEKYATFQPASSLHPNWGSDQAEMMLKQCPSTTDPNTGKQE